MLTRSFGSLIFDIVFKILKSIFFIKNKTTVISLIFKTNLQLLQHFLFFESVSNFTVRTEKNKKLNTHARNISNIYFQTEYANQESIDFHSKLFNDDFKNDDVMNPPNRDNRNDRLFSRNTPSARLDSSLTTPPSTVAMMSPQPDDVFASLEFGASPSMKKLKVQLPSQCGFFFQTTQIKIVFLNICLL